MLTKDIWLVVTLHVPFSHETFSDVGDRTLGFLIEPFDWSGVCGEYSQVCLFQVGLKS